MSIAPHNAPYSGLKVRRIGHLDARHFSRSSRHHSNVQEVPRGQIYSCEILVRLKYRNTFGGIELAQNTSQWNMPDVTSNHHPTNAHQESHEDIDRIVVKEPETTLDTATWLVTPLVRRGS